MGNRHYAAIDIGTNAVRLLVKELRVSEDLMSRSLVKVLMLRVPLRLGFDVFSLGEVSPKKEEKLRRLMKSMRQLMKVYEVDAYRACATSAMRDSVNGPKIIKKILRDTDINVEIIDGQEEASLIYNNHLDNTTEHTGRYVYVDVGGGSTEINVMIDNRLIYSFSYNIGTIRILSEKVEDESWQHLEEDLSRITNKFGNINIIGTGGNINKLYRMAIKKDKKNQRLPIKSLEAIYNELSPLTPFQRQERYGLKEDRADVIVPAAKIFLTIARIVHADYVHVPIIGLADGIINSLYAQDIL